MQHRPPERDRMEERQSELLALLRIRVMQHPFPKENDWRRRLLGWIWSFQKSAGTLSHTISHPAAASCSEAGAGCSAWPVMQHPFPKRTTGGDTLLGWIWSFSHPRLLPNCSKQAQLPGLTDKTKAASKQTAVEQALPPDSRGSSPTAARKRSCPV